MDFPYYPINDFGSVMQGLAIGGLGIFHVFLAQFAIGGGLLMCYLEWRSQTGRSRVGREFVDGYFKLLVLISFVVGAVTGVGMWFTTIQVSPRTIGMMVDEFHWIWATEWAFFSLEIASGYCFYRYGPRLDNRARLSLLALYSLAAWFSLFWINGILSWQLTPGRWMATHSVWDGFFNPSFWPSLIYRTVSSMTIAALVACVVVNFMTNLSRELREGLIHQVAHFLAPMIAMPALGLWYFTSIPEDSRQWVLGGSAAMTLFMTLGVATSALIGAYALFGLIRQQLYVNAATGLLLCALAGMATAGGEFVREGVRKPFTIRGVLYSNSIKADEVQALRDAGSTTGDPYPLPGTEDSPNDQLKLGARVFRFQCSICHTLDGANALEHLTGAWSDEQKRVMISRLQYTKTFMPPFSGNAEELEALVQFLAWHNAERPAEWQVSNDAAVLDNIRRMLAEAGVEPGVTTHHVLQQEARR